MVYLIVLTNIMEYGKFSIKILRAVKLKLRYIGQFENFVSVLVFFYVKPGNTDVLKKCMLMSILNI